MYTPQMQDQGFPGTDKGNHCEWVQQPDWWHQVVFLASKIKKQKWYYHEKLALESISI